MQEGEQWSRQIVETPLHGPVSRWELELVPHERDKPVGPGVENVEYGSTGRHLVSIESPEPFGIISNSSEYRTLKVAVRSGEEPCTLTLEELGKNETVILSAPLAGFYMWLSLVKFVSAHHMCVQDFFDYYGNIGDKRSKAYPLVESDSVSRLAPRDVFPLRQRYRLPKKLAQRLYVPWDCAYAVGLLVEWDYPHTFRDRN